MRSPAAVATDLPDALPSPTSPAATPSHHPSSGRHFYLAVDRLQFKMARLAPPSLLPCIFGFLSDDNRAQLISHIEWIESNLDACEPMVSVVQRTLLELLGVVPDRRGELPIAVCVSSRDCLDIVCAAVANLTFVSISPLVCSFWAQIDIFNSVILCGFSGNLQSWHCSAIAHCTVLVLHLTFASYLYQFMEFVYKVVQYSDQAEPERAPVLEKFRQAALQWNQTKEVLSCVHAV